MKKKILSVIFSFALMASLLTGCGSSDMATTAEGGSSYVSSEKSASADNKGIAYDIEYEESANEDYAEMDMEAAADAEYKDASDNGSNDAKETKNLKEINLLEEKLVYRCNLDIETLDYQSTMSALKDAIKKYNGIIQCENESDDVTNWYYKDYEKTRGTLHNYLEVRVPSANYYDFISELDGTGKIISKSSSIDNISQKYYDTTTQIEALKVQEKNLLEMMEKCETIEDMITVESRLSEIQYKISSLTTDRVYMDMDVAYSYVNIDIREVMEYNYAQKPVKKNTFMDRLKNVINNTYTGFLKFLEVVLFIIIELIPYIIIVLIICFIFRKKIKNFKEVKRAEKELKRAQREMRKQQLMQQAELIKQQRASNQSNIVQNESQNK